MEHTPRIDIAVGLHHRDRTAGDVAPAEPDHPAYPPWHRRRVELLARSQRVEIAGENMKRERTVLFDELLLNSIQQTAKLSLSLPLTPFGEPRAQVQHEDARKTSANLTSSSAWRVRGR